MQLIFSEELVSDKKDMSRITELQTLITLKLYSTKSVNEINL